MVVFSSVGQNSIVINKDMCATVAYHHTMETCTGCKGREFYVFCTSALD
jgi:hypothetical protein